MEGPAVAEPVWLLVMKKHTPLAIIATCGLAAFLFLFAHVGKALHANSAIRGALGRIARHFTTLCYSCRQRIPPGLIVGTDHELRRQPRWAPSS